MKKRKERELFFKLVFMTQFQEKEDIADLISNYLETLDLQEYTKMLTDRMSKLYEKLPEIDELINSLAEGWKTSRMAKVDLALLRVAIFEILYESLEKKIAINEAVELAKEYGEDRSYAFINGILAKVGE